MDKKILVSKSISKKYNEKLILDNINFEMFSGEILGLLGPSGIGKTTLLNILVGLEKETSGEIINYHNNKIGYVFQEDRLLNWLTLFENIKLIKEDIANFKGNIEAREILEHKYDIVIADGFAGNILLKSIEGVASSLGKMIKGIFLENIITKISALLVKNGISKFKKKFDYSEYGGAFLLGIKKPSIKIHGSADENALYYAVQQAKQIHKTKLYDIMIETMEKGEQK